MNKKKNAILAAIDRVLGRFNGSKEHTVVMSHLEDVVDLHTSAFPRLSPVAKYPIFRKPNLDAGQVLGFALEFVNQAFVPHMTAAGSRTVGDWAATLREMSEDRETVIITPVGGVQLKERGKATVDLKISRLEIRIAQPLLARMLAGEGGDWNQVATVIAKNISGAIANAQKLDSEFEANLDDVRAHTFSILAPHWVSDEVFTVGFAIYVHWISDMFYVVLGEMPEDFDSWVRYGRIGAATHGLFNQ